MNYLLLRAIYWDISTTSLTYDITQSQYFIRQAICKNYIDPPPCSVGHVDRSAERAGRRCGERGQVDLPNHQLPGPAGPSAHQAGQSRHQTAHRYGHRVYKQTGLFHLLTHYLYCAGG